MRQVLYIFSSGSDADVEEVDLTLLSGTEPPTMYIPVDWAISINIREDGPQHISSPSLFFFSSADDNESPIPGNTSAYSGKADVA